MCKLEHRCWRACGEDVSFTDVKVKIPDRKFDQEVWMTSCTESARGGFWGFKKKLVELRTRFRTGRVDFRGSLTPHVMGSRCRSHHGSLCISLPYVETFNSKVIKSFVPELRSRKCFSCFRIPIFYVYMLWTFYVHFTYPYLAMVFVFKIWNTTSAHDNSSLLTIIIIIIVFIIIKMCRHHAFPWISLDTCTEQSSVLVSLLDST